MTLGIIAYNQLATYWGSPSQGGFGGNVFAAPTLTNVRWEDRIETFTDLSGDEKISKSIVYMLIDVEIGGYLARGDQTATADPTELDLALEVQRIDRTPDLRGLTEEIRAYL